MGVFTPFAPVCVGAGGSVNSNSLLDVLLSKAEVTDEIVVAGKWTRLQDGSCGKEVTNRAVKVEGERWAFLDAKSAIGLDGPAM